MRRVSVTVLAASAALALLAGPAAAQPVNDGFDDAIGVVSLPSFDAVNVSEATVQPGEPDEDCAPVANTVWYAMTLDEATDVAVDTAGSDYDTVLGIYTGTSVDDLELVSCNDDQLGLQSRVVFRADAGTTYWVQVAAFDELDGSGDLSLAFRRGAAGGIECDAEFEGFDDLVYYFVSPGDDVTCLARGLDADEPVSWQVEFVDYEQEDLPQGVEEVDLTPDEDGTLAFSFSVPDDVQFGEFEAVVTQGDDGVESYREPAYGLIEGDVVDPVLACDPDPASPGDTVDCTVEQLRPFGAYFWVVEFLDADQLALDDEFFEEYEDSEEYEDLGDEFGDELVDELGGVLLEELGEEFLDEVAPGAMDEVETQVLAAVEGEVELFLEGDGEADEDGLGRLAFDVPDDEDIVAYRVTVFTDVGGYASVDGAVLAAAAPTTPEPTGEAPGPGPTAVPRPVRIDTGAGGAATPEAPRDIPPAATLVGLALVSMVASASVRRTTRA